MANEMPHKFNIGAVVSYRSADRAHREADAVYTKTGLMPGDGKPTNRDPKEEATMKAAQPMSITIRQLEFELEKAEHGMSMPYDDERVAQLRSMLREARKRKLSAGLRARWKKSRR